MQPSYTREDLVRELNIDALPREAQDEIIAGVSQNVIKHILIEILARLPEDAGEQFKDHVDAGRGTEAQVLATQFIPDLTSFIQVESRKGIEEYKSFVAQAA